MKKLYMVLAVLVANVFSTAIAQSPNWVWAKNIGGHFADGGLDVAVDANGNVYTVGFFRDTVDFDPGPGTFIMISDTSNGGVFLSKMDSTGNFIWAKQWSNWLYNTYSVDIDLSNNVFITGNFTGTIDIDPGPATYNIAAGSNMIYFILKLDTQGNFAWVKTFGGCLNSPVCYSAIDAAGNIYSAGMFSHSYDFNPGPPVYSLTAVNGRNIFILKLDASGNFVWVKQIGGTFNNWVGDIQLDETDNIYLTGGFSGTTDFDPGPGADSLTAGTNVYEDIFIAKYDSSGNYAWAKRIGGTYFDRGLSIEADVQGNVFTAGYFFCGGPVDFDPGPGTYIINDPGYNCFISKLDNAGNFVFAKSIHSAGGSVFGRGLALNPNGDIYYCGEYYGTADFDPGPGVYNLAPDTALGVALFISKLDNAGNFIWAESKGGDYYVGAQQNIGTSLFSDAAGNIYFTGKFADPDITFGSTVLLSNNPASMAYSDAFIAKIGVNTGVGINDDIENNNQGIYIYPNPSTGTFILHSSETIAALEIYNILGEKIYSSFFSESSSRREISLIATSGIYFIKASSGDKVRTQKLIIR